MRTKCTPFDIALAAGILLLAIFLPFFLFRDNADTVRIVSESGEKLYALGEERTIEVLSGGHRLTVCIDYEGVFVVDTDCKDRVCEKTGKIIESGDVIVCAPAGVKIELISKRGGADYVVG
ncbi:MAG: NusG domain II-containing protein [Clostridia bacterium]|nr:NusG domain II-containing protein [Clostridia bacterium]